MTTQAIVDSSGWLEYLNDGANAPTFEPLILSATDLIVPTIVLFEVAKIVRRLRGDEYADKAAKLMMRGQVVDLDAALALDAARLSAELQLPMADSIILATARRHEAMLWTQDADFAGIDGVEYIAKI